MHEVTLSYYGGIKGTSEIFLFIMAHVVAKVCARDSFYVRT